MDNNFCFFLVNRLQINPLSTHSEAPALQMLKNHGISMLTDDTDNTLFNSALQNGRKLVLSDAGKLLLNDIKYKKIVPTSSSSNNNIELPPLSSTVTHATVTKPKPPVLMTTNSKPIPSSYNATVKGTKGVSEHNCM